MKIIINLDVLVLQVNRNDPFVLFPLLCHYLQPSISKNSVGVTEINYPTDTILRHLIERVGDVR